MLAIAEQLEASEREGQPAIDGRGPQLRAIERRTQRLGIHPVGGERVRERHDLDHVAGLGEPLLEDRQRRRIERATHVGDRPAIERPGRDPFRAIDQQPAFIGEPALAITEGDHAQVVRRARVARRLLETPCRSITIPELRPRRRGQPPLDTGQRLELLQHALRTREVIELLAVDPRGVAMDPDAIVGGAQRGLERVAGDRRITRALGTLEQIHRHPRRW